MITLVALSILIGLTLGLLGGGGSILTVPVLIYAIGMGEKPAIATSLFVVAVTSAVAAVQHAFAGNVRWRIALLFGGAGMAGAFTGGQLARFLPAWVLLVGFSLIMFGTGWAMWRGRKVPEAPGETKHLPTPKILGEGLLVGLVTGLVGAGGGFLVVPALVLLGRLGMREAVGTSLVVIAMKSAAGLAGYAGHVAIDWETAFLVTALAVVGSFAGMALSRYVNQESLRRAFAAFVLVMATGMLIMQIPKALRMELLSQPWPIWLGAVVIAVTLVILARMLTRGHSTGRKSAR